MPAHPNPKIERFLQFLVLQAMPKHEAVVAAGYKPKHKRSALALASHMLAQDNTRARYEELTQEQVDAQIPTRERITAEIDSIIDRTSATDDVQAMRLRLDCLKTLGQMWGLNAPRRTETEARNLNLYAAAPSPSLSASNARAREGGPGHFEFQRRLVRAHARLTGGSDPDPGEGEGGSPPA